MKLGSSKIFLVVFLFANQLFADGSPLLKSLENIYFYNYEDIRFGLEIEYTNVSLDEAAKIAQEVLGGTITKGYNKEGIEGRVIKGSKIGDLKINVETNQTGEAIPDKSQWVYEIVGPPLSFEQNTHIQRFLDRLKQAGAKGSEDGTAVSIQTNTEKRFKNTSRMLTDADVEFEFKVMRNFYINFETIMKELSPVDSRIKYIQAITPEMMKRMKDPNYQPNAKQILVDYIYRQSLELSGNKRAWTMSNGEAKILAGKMNFPIIKRVVKLNAYRFSSMLMYRFPRDPYLQKYKYWKWTFSAPITEQRARNNDFDVISPMKQIIGLKNATMKLGLFKFNSSSGELESLEVKTCKRLF